MKYSCFPDNKSWWCPDFPLVSLWGWRASNQLAWILDIYLLYCSPIIRSKAVLIAKLKLCRRVCMFCTAPYLQLFLIRYIIYSLHQSQQSSSPSPQRQNHCHSLFLSLNFRLAWKWLRWISVSPLSCSKRFEWVHKTWRFKSSGTKTRLTKMQLDFGFTDSGEHTAPLPSTRTRALRHVPDVF